MHYHHCPFCYEAFSCEMRCTIEPDLEDRGRDFGSHTVCHNLACQLAAAAQRYDERHEQRKRDALQRLQSPLQNVGTDKDARYILPGVHRRPVA